MQNMTKLTLNLSSDKSGNICFLIALMAVDCKLHGATLKPYNLQHNHRTAGYNAHSMSPPSYSLRLLQFSECFSPSINLL